MISLGSNIDPERFLPLALERLASIGRLIAVSNAYQNPAVGGRPQPDFLNAAALLQVEQDSAALRRRLREIEAGLGRARTADKYAPRTIDLDLVWLGDRLESDPPLPDPEIERHPHLAIPLAELAPERRHPRSGEALRSIADRLRPDSALTVRPDVSARLRQVLREHAEPPSLDGQTSL